MHVNENERKDTNLTKGGVFAVKTQSQYGP